MPDERLPPLPPLHALRSFHAAARFGRFREAAAALGLTESAISHQVRKLEDYLSVRLFERRGNAVALTLVGQTYFDEIDPAFSRIRAATEALSGPCCRVSLTLPSSLATFWLIPRLGQLESELPEINLQMSPSNRVVDLKRDQIDLAIRHGRGSWPGLAAEHLFDEQSFPICRPGFLAEGTSPQEALASARLIISAAHPPEWTEWAQARGLAPPRLDNALTLEGTEQILEAAAGGLGLAIGRRPMVDRWVEEGRVEAPFGTADQSGYAYFLVYRQDGELTVPARRLARWLMRICKGEAAAAALFAEKPVAPA
ncbi:LysR substrate-binding domain-containing protein [Afifella pfennigii]|uniref:LysR substrate-binding domain-containing protein n=1 Tax=Afifella pfennigii TaxID=209897 RepID=UPI000689ECCE|nr:LysR substrate-binding domain-containing protein [Afifella pfennigii]